MEKSTTPDARGVRVVLVTVPDVETGVSIARKVVEERLAACGNVIPGLTSVYRWEGAIQEDPEALILFKTTEDALESLRKRTLELHPYEVAEFLAMPVERGHIPYLEWVMAEVENFEGGS